MAEFLQWSGRVDDRRVRTTSTTPRQVSVIDLICAVTRQESNAARKTLHDLRHRHAEVAGMCNAMRFSGRGQRPTPVTDARGVVQIINLLPGTAAAAYRAAGADVLVRYLGGDETLVAEVRRNRELQQNMPAEDPATLFAQPMEDVAPNDDQPDDSTEAQLPLVVPVVTPAICGHVMSGVYLVKYGPLLLVQTDLDVFGYGWTDHLSRRITDHRRRFGGCELLHFEATYNSVVETKFQQALRVQGRLVRGKVQGEAGEIEELFTACGEEEWAQTRQLLQRLAQANPHPLDRSHEIELELARAKHAAADVDARIAEATASIEVARERARAEIAVAEADSRARVAEADSTARIAEANGKRAREETPAQQPVVSGGSAGAGLVTFRVPLHKEGDQPITQWTLQGEYIDYHDTAFAATTRVPSAYAAGLSMCLDGKRDSCGGYVWRRVPMTEWRTKTITTRLNHTGRVLQYDASGETLINRYASAGEAGGIVGCHAHSINSGIKNGMLRRMHIWRWAEQTVHY